MVFCFLKDLIFKGSPVNAAHRAKFTKQSNPRNAVCERFELPFDSDRNRKAAHSMESIELANRNAWLANRIRL